MPTISPVAFPIVRDPDTGVPVAPAGHSLWVKKLGQCHLSRHGQPTTVCGKPMLGNNYASSGIEMEICEECWGVKINLSVCDKCGEPYTKKDIDGGRCSCGAMIC